MAEEMRTCKTCGETKPLERFHIANRRNPNRSYYKSCKTCRNKETNQKQAERRAAEKIEFSSRPARASATRLPSHTPPARYWASACGQIQARQGNARDAPYPALPRIGKPILADLAQQGGQERTGGGV